MLPSLPLRVGAFTVSTQAKLFVIPDSSGANCDVVILSKAGWLVDQVTKGVQVQLREGLTRDPGMFTRTLDNVLEMVKQLFDNDSCSNNHDDFSSYKSEVIFVSLSSTAVVNKLLTAPHVNGINISVCVTPPGPNGTAPQRGR